jgi:hypothetical protein
MIRRLFEKINLMLACQPRLCQTCVVDSLSFKERMVNDIIPFVEIIIEKEKNLLHWLESKNAPKELIESSKWHLDHFRQRHKEYIEYAEGLS